MESLRAAWERTVALLREIWNVVLFELGEEQTITVGTVLGGIALLVFGLLAARVLTRWLARLAQRRLKMEEGVAASVQSLLFYVSVVLVVIMVLHAVSVPLTAFTLLGGALAIGLGFGSQALMSNFLSGMILLIERPIRVGDLVQVGEFYGSVTRIGLRSTRLVTPGNFELVVPNSSFLNDRVTNWTLSDDKIRTQITVGVIYGSPTRTVQELLLKAASEHGKVLDDPPPFVLFTNFGDDSLVFELVFWVRMRRMLQRRVVESDLRFMIDHLFREAGIVIAFPQRDVHLHPGKPLQVEISRAQPDTRTQ